MENIILVCGRWVFEKNRWMFHVDNERGSKLLTADESTCFDDFVAMVYEDYELDKEVCDVELSYMIPKEKLHKSLLDTPPVKGRNFRQFIVFMGLFKSDRVRLCVEVKEKNDCDVNDRGISENNVDGNDESKYEDDYSRFDYCDDSDGKTSEDGDFRPYGLVEEDVVDKKTTTLVDKPLIHAQKMATTHTTLDLETLKIVVGQCFEKEALVTRLKILAVLHHFDFDVDRSTPSLFVAKCWVKGCVWKLRASTIGDSSHLTIRAYVSEHTCSVIERSARSRQATSDILGLLYKDYIGGVGSKVLPSHVAESMKNTFNVKMDYWKAHRTLKCARELVVGSPESGYNELPAYLHMTTTLTRGVEKLLGARIPYATKLIVQAIDLHQVQVTRQSSLHVVDLKEKKCSCRRFDLEKIPCVHAIAATEAKQVSAISLCHPYYHKSYLCNAYSAAIMPKNDDIPIPEHVSRRVCLPPLIRQPPGRPKKSRIKSILERNASTRRPRKKHRCSLCKQVGHNRSTCSLS